MKTRSLTLALSALALATASFVASAADHVFSNTAQLQVESGNATPYPSNIPVSGLGGNITQVTVTLHGFSSGDLYSPLLLLVAPGGQKIMLTNGAPNGTKSTSNATWTFSASGVAVPSGAVPSGTYLPSSFFPDTPPPPAPAGPYSTDLTTINGAAAGQNGSWELYVRNFIGGINQTALTIASGWTLNITDDVPDTTCASEGYTGTKLTWCRNICESELSQAALDTWIHRWINRYRELPYCAVDEEQPPQEQPPA